MPRTPDFFIIGAPKCGTTALYTYLKGHPRIFMSEKKEPQYYGTDLANYANIEGPDAYYALFSPAADNQLCGEGSVMYFYSEAAVPNILKENPAAKFILMLRDPVDAILARHNQSLADLDEDEPSFEKAWRLIPNRKRGLNIPKSCRNPRVLYYDDMYSYGSLLKRLFQSANREQVLIISFESFAQDPAREYARVLSFLNLEPHNKTDFPPINERYQLKSRNTQKVLKWVGKLPLFKPLSRVGGALNFHPFRYMSKLNRKPRAREHLSEELKAEIRRTLAEDIVIAEEICGFGIMRRD